VYLTQFWLVGTDIQEVNLVLAVSRYVNDHGFHIHDVSINPTCSMMSTCLHPWEVFPLWILIAIGKLAWAVTVFWRVLWEIFQFQLLLTEWKCCLSSSWFLMSCSFVWHLWNTLPATQWPHHVSAYSWYWQWPRNGRSLPHINSFKFYSTFLRQTIDIGYVLYRYLKITKMPTKFLCTTAQYRYSS
jgi:hypothetical protein